MAIDQCPVCGFAPELYNRADTVSSQRAIGRVVQAAAEGIDTNDSVAPILEQAHVGVVATLAALESGLGVSTQVVPDIEAGFSQLHSLLKSLNDDDWQATSDAMGQAFSVQDLARNVIHEGLHAMALVGRTAADLGRGATPGVGTVEQLSVSNGGVPKLSVDKVAVGPTGLTGDTQKDRLHHGRPIQAICVWSGDVIRTLASEGHPIAAGSAGENITVSGVDWRSLRPGSLLQIGDLRLLVTAHAVPCAKNAQWFSDRDFNRILHENNPGLSRLYAVPFGSGTVSVGDVVTVEPDR